MRFISTQNKRMLFTGTWIALVCGMAACSSHQAGQAEQPCLEYNQGMRITSNVDWPRATEAAQSILRRKLRTESISVRMKGPERYDALRGELLGLLEPAIVNAGDCYQGSLFEKIVNGVKTDLAKLDESIEDDRVVWASRERERAEREAALINLPDERKIRKTEEIKVEIVSIMANRGRTSFRLMLTNLSMGRIIRPVTGSFYGFDQDSPNVGGVRPIGFSLSDNFSNRFPLVSAKPELTGHSGAGLHPGESQAFDVRFTGGPPATADQIILVVDKGTFGNNEVVSFALPRSIFLP